ncbi:MAG TPA: hypothetical protein VN903_30960 [Polyangia bacterium]|jgi:hypothetical protein|nr:hypothetical protein [Polyangia bacterium]
MRRSLPVINDKLGSDALDLVEIPIPCQVPWDSMPGDEQVRHCGQCKQNVYNVSSLTRAEAIRLLSARACLRIYRRPDNTVLTSDCRERLRVARKKGLWVFAGTLLIVLWAQICAQFVGLMGLKRLVGAGEHTMGAPVPIAVPGQIAPPPPPVIEMGTPPEPPLMGEIAPVKGRISVPKPPKHRLMGKPAMPSSEKMGKIKIPIIGLEG